MGRSASEVPTSSIRRKIEKLCLDAESDRQRFEEIANNPLCEIVDRQYNSTAKGVLWLTIEYDSKHNLVVGLPPAASQTLGGLTDGNNSE